MTPNLYLFEPPLLAESDRFNDALARDAIRIDMPAGEVFRAERFAMFTDRFGTPWMLDHTGSTAP